MPTDAASMLDVAAPLMPMQPAAPEQVMPAAIQFAPAQPTADPVQPAAPMQAAAAQAQAAPQFSPPQFAAPATPAAPVEQPVHHTDHPTSLAMPAQAEHPTPVQAMPEGYALASPETQFDTEVGGVRTTSAEDPADLHAAHAADGVVGAVPGEAPAWMSPGIALVIAMFALAWQLVAYYATHILPDRLVTGADLDQFDNLAGLPLFAGTIGSMVGLLLGFGALVVMMLGIRSGIREPVLQGAIGLLGVLAAAATVWLPMIAG